jgi:hypothetical protein
MVILRAPDMRWPYSVSQVLSSLSSNTNLTVTSTVILRFYRMAVRVAYTGTTLMDHGDVLDLSDPGQLSHIPVHALTFNLHS